MCSFKEIKLQMISVLVNSKISFITLFSDHKKSKTFFSCWLYRFLEWLNEGVKSCWNELAVMHFTR